MRSLLKSALVAVLLAASATVGADVARLKTFLGELKSLESAFEQTVEDEKGRNLESSFGRFYLSRPGKFRWSYTVPYVQEIVSDGEDVWIYDSELAQVTVKSAREALANAPGLLLSSNRPLEAEFTLADLGRKGDLEWVELTPKSAEAPFRKVRIGLRGRDLAEMELADGFGQLTRLRFKGAIKNPKLNPDLFRFEPPEGVDVMRDAPGPR
ncbi:MAG: outer membrane lipoprotein chaperone LolA [Gammaproteobacteria bacterium]|jgi:chaperone LolA|nr:outer membrane lipoprotein chaperone LolA [Gammaproteobacteria bacterium]